MRADYFQRYAGFLSGGLAKLQREGALFLNAHHLHANTETAPGHATLSTGAHPARHGIIGNYWFDAASGKRIYSVADSQVKIFDSSALGGSSPHHLMSRGLGDWLKAEHPKAKVVSISRKDRSAILLGGQKPDAAYWYNTRNGGFTSSSHYFNELPDWVKAWNERRDADKFFGKTWQKSRPEEEYFASREDLFDGEADGPHSTFPHAYAPSEPNPGEGFYGWLPATPFCDELTLAFATAALRAEQLGADDITDLLCISLSSTDAVGHNYGPLSQEMQDNIMRLDDALGEFFLQVDSLLGLENCLISLSSDHGVLPLPEELRRRGFETARIREQEYKDELTGVLTELAQELGADRQLFKHAAEDLYVNYASADSLGLDHENFRLLIAKKIRTMSFVADAMTAAELAGDGPSAHEFAERFRNSYYPGRSADVLIRYKPFFLISARETGTNHGSVYDYDSRVPMVFWGGNVLAGHYSTPCATVDFAPTMARLIGIAVPQDIDGKALAAIVQN